VCGASRAVEEMRGSWERYRRGSLDFQPSQRPVPPPAGSTSAGGTSESPYLIPCIMWCSLCLVILSLLFIRCPAQACSSCVASFCLLFLLSRGQSSAYRQWLRAGVHAHTVGGQRAWSTGRDNNFNIRQCVWGEGEKVSLELWHMDY
jgi:hypothetical protein